MDKIRYKQFRADLRVDQLTDNTVWDICLRHAKRDFTLAAKLYSIEYSDVTRVDLIVSNGESIALFFDKDGKMSICATHLNKVADFTPVKGYTVKVDSFGYPSD